MTSVSSITQSQSEVMQHIEQDVPLQKSLRVTRYTYCDVRRGSDICQSVQRFVVRKGISGRQASEDTALHICRDLVQSGRLRVVDHNASRYSI